MMADQLQAIERWLDDHYDCDRYEAREHISVQPMFQFKDDFPEEALQKADTGWRYPHSVRFHDGRVCNEPPQRCLKCVPKRQTMFDEDRDD